MTENTAGEGRNGEFEILDETRSGIVTKWLAGMAGGGAAEFVLIERPEKNIVCFSTMVGCPVGCGFCASGAAGLYSRRLGEGEMTAMMGEAMRRAENPDRPWVMSAMGEGEPAANIEAVLAAFGRLPRRDGIKSALSTSAPTPALLARTLSALEDFASRDGREPKLQYSLHSAMPSERAAMFRESHMPPDRALAMLRASGYGNVEINVTLIEGWNDSPESADALADVLTAHGTWYVKINRFNAVEGLPHEAAGPEAYGRLRSTLSDAGHVTEYYETDGNDISAACGQLHHRHERTLAPGLR